MESTTRRALIGAIGLGLPVAALAHSAPAAIMVADTKDWDAAIAHLDRCEAVSQTFDREVFDPTYLAWRAACDAIPHQTFTTPYRREPLSTANSYDVADARRSTKGKYWIDPAIPEAVAHDEAMRKLVAAADARAAERRRIERELGWDAINERSDGLSEACCDAEGAVLAIPAPDGTALMWKLDRLFGPGACTNGSTASWSEEYIAPVLADARRLLSGEA